MKIREATLSDEQDIYALYMSAFGATEAKLVAALSIELLKVESSPKTYGLVAESGSLLIGHVVFSPVRSMADGSLLGYMLAPLAVDPEMQKKKIGSTLVEEGIRILKENSVEVFFVYGDPRYYSRFGFTVVSVKRYAPPYPLTFEHGWQVMHLKENPSSKTSEELECLPMFSNKELW